MLQTVGVEAQLTVGRHGRNGRIGPSEVDADASEEALIVIQMGVQQLVIRLTCGARHAPFDVTAVVASVGGGIAVAAVETCHAGHDDRHLMTAVDGDVARRVTSDRTVTRCGDGAYERAEACAACRVVEMALLVTHTFIISGIRPVGGITVGRDLSVGRRHRAGQLGRKTQCGPDATVVCGRETDDDD